MMKNDYASYLDQKLSESQQGQSAVQTIQQHRAHVLLPLRLATAQQLQLRIQSKLPDVLPLLEVLQLVEIGQLLQQVKMPPNIASQSLNGVEEGLVVVVSFEVKRVPLFVLLGIFENDVF